MKKELLLFFFLLFILPSTSYSVGLNPNIREDTLISEINHKSQSSENRLLKKWKVRVVKSIQRTIGISLFTIALYYFITQWLGYTYESHAYLVVLIGIFAFLSVYSLIDLIIGIIGLSCIWIYSLFKKK